MEHRFALEVASGAGPVRTAATFADPMAAAVAAYRRCRMHGVDPTADAQWAGVTVAVGRGRVLLVECRRAPGGVRLELISPERLARVLPGVRLPISLGARPRQLTRRAAVPSPEPT